MEYHLKILHNIVGYLNFRVGLRNIHFDGTLDKQKKARRIPAGTDTWILHDIARFCYIGDHWWKDWCAWFSL